MTFTKALYISAVLLIFPVALSAQEPADTKSDTPIASIQDLHVATATNLLIEDVNGDVALSQEYYDASAIPDRVARLIKESLLEDTLLAEQTAQEFKNIKERTIAQEEDFVLLGANQESALPMISFTSGGGL